MYHKFLCCPVCKNDIDDCYCKHCNIKFPIVKDIPVLINEKNSLFSFDGYSEKDSYSFWGNGKKSKWIAIKKYIPFPSYDVNYASQPNYRLMSKLLMEKSDRPQVLIIGGGVKGKGIDELFTNPNIGFTITDVSLTEDVQVVCDAHDLPFKSNTFDGIVAQAVLEHVVDPYRCVEEFHRVLKDGGIIYAETPFMQQVHGGAYDFTRFTWLGHRRLFRQFEEIKSGTYCGPGAALAWSWRYFLSTFSKNQKTIKLLQYVARLTSFFWKYFDYYLKKKPNVIDAASGNYFMGTKRNDYILTDRELIKLYERKKKELFIHEHDISTN